MVIDHPEDFSELVDEFIGIGERSATLVSEMDKIILSSRRMLAESRELLAKIDFLLEQDAPRRQTVMRGRGGQ